MSINRPAMKEHQLAKLPDLVWQKIFRFLEYDDLLNLNKVYGELKDLLSRYVESRTVVINQSKESYLRSAFSNEYLLSHSLIRLQMNSDMHLSIKKLVLYNPFRLYNLRNFDNLTSLTIEATANLKLQGQFMISLKNLENFDTLISNSSGVSIVLEAPKLVKFYVDLDLDQLQILHPRSVKTASSPRLCRTVKEMVNLERLETYDFAISDAGNFFGDLKRLRQFVFFKRDDDLNITNEYLRSAQLANPNLRIFFKTVDINSNALQDAELDQISDLFLNDQSLAVYQKYVDVLDESLNHLVLQIHDLQSLPAALLRNLTPLEDLQIVGEINDGEKWCELLKLPKLFRLTINATLKQEQLELIPEHCPFVTYLEITPFECGDWLLRLKYLEEFRTDLRFDFELLKRMVRQFYRLKVLRVESYEIKIEDAVVECISNGDVVLREPKPVFLQTIESVDLWSELFEPEF